jgi:hypothetical protein
LTKSQDKFRFTSLFLSFFKAFRSDGSAFFIRVFVLYAAEGVVSRRTSLLHDGEDEGDEDVRPTEDDDDEGEHVEADRAIVFRVRLIVVDVVESGHDPAGSNN